MHPWLRLTLTSRPEAARLVRGMSTGAGEALGFDAELLSDVNTAVSEACNNIIVHAYEHGPGPFSVELQAVSDGLEVQIRDHGRGIRHTALEYDGIKVGLALMSALADRAEFIAAPEGGTEVRLSFKDLRMDSNRAGTADSAQAEGRDIRSEGAQEGALALAAQASFRSASSGDVVLTVSPVGLLAPVLGRLGRALAPSAGFSLDRCADVYLVTDALGAHAERAAESSSISVALGASDRCLEFALAPLRQGTSDRLEPAGAKNSGTALSWLTDGVAVSQVDGHETLRVSMRDHRRA